MSNRKHLLPLMVAVAMVVLFAASLGMAQTEDCPLYSSTTSTNNQYTLTVVPGGPDNTFPYPVEYPDPVTGLPVTWYKYDYYLDNTDVDGVFISIPYRCSDPIKMHPSAVPANKLEAPGAGSGGIGVGDYSVQILKVPPTVNRVSYVMDRDTLGPVSVFETKGKFTYTSVRPIGGVGYESAEILTTDYEYHALLTMCVEEKLDDDFNIVGLRYGCFRPDLGETCPGSVTSWTDASFVPDQTFWIGGASFNVRNPSSWKIKNKQDVYDLCPRVDETSFMDFLTPSEAYAQTCTPGVCTRSGCWCF